MLYIEDYIEALAGMNQFTFKIANSDHNLINSFARQTARGIPFTDRQFALAKKKIQEYSSQFVDANISLDNIESLRMPLRHIDRSKTVKFYDKFPAEPDQVYESWKDEYNWLEVRFPFSKKDIIKIEEVKAALGSYAFYHHTKGSHKHYFANIKSIAYLLTQKFPSFTTDKIVKELATQQEVVVKNIKDYIPRVSKKQLYNVTDDLQESFENELDTDSNQLQFVDRAFRYNLDIDTVPVNNSLTETIAFRNESSILIPPDMYTLDRIVESLFELDRFPMLVLVDDKDLFAETKEFYNAIQYMVPSENQSVLFRAETNDKENVQLNDFVKEKKLNNWVDNTTKIVYIKKNKIPKVLLTSDFSPITAFAKSASRMHTIVDNYVNFYCDLIIRHDSQQSLFTKYTRRY